MNNWVYFKDFESAYFDLDRYLDAGEIKSGGEIELTVECCCGFDTHIFTSIAELKAIIKAWDERNGMSKMSTKCDS